MSFSTLRIRKAVSGLTAATALALGATVLAAPSASAVDSSGCTKNIKDQTLQVVQWDHADMHTGPGYSYKVKKSVFAGTDVRVYCTAYKKGTTWYYGKSGKTKGWMDTHAFF
ncbi:hypothetical protein ABT131_03015 [Streptomyces sp900105245]|uniref:hypothetical protein n=1 Tax=Streptomyces sp. 900105245 TaxID=3154379 RepID=UPI00332A09F1